MLGRMGMEVAFFAAEDDHAAAEAEHRVGGPLARPAAVSVRQDGGSRSKLMVKDPGPAFDGFASRWYDAVTMGTLEELLTGTTYCELEKDTRFAATITNDSPDDEPPNRGVLSLTHTLRDALAAVDDDRLAALVGPWTATDEFGYGWQDTTPEDHLAFLRRLRELARTAQDRDHGLYWYFALCPDS
jgi:hypothetical protein